MTHLNAKAVRELALHYASTHRAQVKFTRVSKDFLERIEYKLRAIVLHEVKTHPSRGTTLK
jgi:hypothetical protein